MEREHGIWFVEDSPSRDDRLMRANIFLREPYGRRIMSRPVSLPDPPRFLPRVEEEEKEETDAPHVNMYFFVSPQCTYRHYTVPTETETETETETRGLYDL